MIARILLLPLVLLAAGADGAAQIGSAYQETANGKCLISQAGFNPDDTAILSDGMLVTNVTYTSIGPATFDSATGTGVFKGKQVITTDTFVPGNPPFFAFASSGVQEKRQFAYALTTNGSGQTVLTITPKQHGITGSNISGANMGATFTISNAAASQGTVNPSGLISLTGLGPVVATELWTYNGTTTTFYLICSETETLIPVQ